MKTITSLVVGLGVLAAPAVQAQDISSPYSNAVADFGMIQLQSRLNRQRIDQAQQRTRGPAATAQDEKVDGYCRNRAQLSRRLSPANALKLQRACIGLGY